MLCKYQIQRDEAVQVKVAAVLVVRRFAGFVDATKSGGAPTIRSLVPAAGIGAFALHGSHSIKKLRRRRSLLVITERASGLVSTPNCFLSPHQHTMHRELALCQLEGDGSLAGCVQIDAGWRVRKRLA